MGAGITAPARWGAVLRSCPDRGAAASYHASRARRAITGSSPIRAKVPSRMAWHYAQPRHGSARPNHRQSHTGENECGENDGSVEPNHDGQRGDRRSGDRQRGDGRRGHGHWRPDLARRAVLVRMGSSPEVTIAVRPGPVGSARLASVGPESIRAGSLRRVGRNSPSFVMVLPRLDRGIDRTIGPSTLVRTSFATRTIRSCRTMPLGQRRRDGRAHEIAA